MLIKKIFKLPANSIKIQLLRYVLSGGFTFLADIVCLYLLTEFVGLHYILSSILSFLVGLTLNYLLSIFWIFNKRVMSKKYVEFGIFFLISSIGLGLTVLFMYLFTEIIHLYYLQSKIISAGMVFFWNFSAKKTILFK
jgi:putative flippase GtrA